VLKITRGDWLKIRHPRLNNQPNRGVEGQVLEENPDQKADILAPGGIELARIDLIEREDKCLKKRIS